MLLQSQVYLLERTRAEGVEAEALAGMHDRQLAGQRKHRTLASGVRKLGSSSSHESDKAGSVDDAAVLLVVTAQAQHGMLAAKPDALDVDALCQIPNLFGRVDCVGVVGVHDARVVEHHVGAPPAILGLDCGLHVGLLGHVAAYRFKARGVGDDLLHLGDGLGQGGLRDVGHEDVGAFAGEENGGFETDATILVEIISYVMRI